MAVCGCAIGQHPLLTINDVLHVWSKLEFKLQPQCRTRRPNSKHASCCDLCLFRDSRYSSVTRLSYPPSSTSSKLKCPHLSLTKEPHRPTTANTQLSMASDFTLSPCTVPHLGRHCTRFATQLIHRPSLHPGLIGSDCGVYTFCR